MKICANSKIVDVQKDATFGFVVYSNGKCVMKGSKTYEMAVAEYKRLAEDAKYEAA